MGISFSRLQGYQGYRRGTQGWVSQGYKAIKATGGGCRDGFLKATRLSRLQEGDAGMGFSRLQGYQGYRRWTLGLVSQGYKAIKATGGGGRDGFLKATRLSRLQEGDRGISFSRLQGYQGYRRGTQGYVSQGYRRGMQGWVSQG